MSYKSIQKGFSELFAEIGIQNKHLRKKITQVHKHEYAQEFWAASSYLSVIDLAENVVFLLGSKKPVGMPSLVRDCIDAYINFLNIVKRYDYFIRGEKDALLKDIERIRGIEKQHLTKDGLVVLATRVTDIKSRLILLKDVEPKYINQSKKRKGIELEEGISEFYEILSDHTHSGLSALMQRHLSRKGDRNKISIQTTLDKEIIVVMLRVLLGVIYSIMVKFNFFMRSNSNHNFKNILLIYKKLCYKLRPRQLSK